MGALRFHCQAHSQAYITVEYNVTLREELHTFITVTLPFQAMTTAPKVLDMSGPGSRI